MEMSKLKNMLNKLEMDHPVAYEALSVVVVVLISFIILIAFAVIGCLCY